MTDRCLIAACTFTVCLVCSAEPSTAQQAVAPGAPTQQSFTGGIPPAPGANQQIAVVGPLAASAAKSNALAPLQQPPAQPFQLSEEEQQFVRQTLEMWENTSTQVNTFTADFEKWTYDGVWGQGLKDPMIKSTGTISFSKPDKGSFKEEKISRWIKKDPQNTAVDAPGDWVPQPDEVGDHWVCDGKAVYEYNHRDKQLVVNPIPEHMRGQSIVDGPLPFLFGAEAKKLMERYWIRTKQSAPAEIWLEAYPRWQADAANYDYVDVMLDRKTMQPKAIQVHLPGGQQVHLYMFKDARVNEKNVGTWITGLFSSPRTPLGWTKVMADTAPPPQAAAPQGAIQR